MAGCGVIEIDTYKIAGHQVLYLLNKCQALYLYNKCRVPCVKCAPISAYAQIPYSESNSTGVPTTCVTILSGCLAALMRKAIIGAKSPEYDTARLCLNHNWYYL